VVKQHGLQTVMIFSNSPAQCGAITTRVYSHYRRLLVDLPLAGRQVQLVGVATPRPVVAQFSRNYGATVWMRSRVASPEMFPNAEPLPHVIR
jgi:hypothetical protein